MKRVCLFTATGAENLGDELICICEISHIRKIYGNVHIIVFSHDTERTRRFFLSQKISTENMTLQEYFPKFIRIHPLKNITLLWATYKAIKNSDHTYIGGGGLFYAKTDEGHSPILLWSIRIALIKFLKKSITYLSLGISATPKDLQWYAGVLFRGTTITVRDRNSLDTVQRLGYDGQILPDPVFTLPSPETKKNNSKKIIGIALRKGFIEDTVLKKIIEKLIQTGHEVLLLPHSLHIQDENSHDGYYLQDYLLPGVMTTQSIEQTLEGYKKCDIVIAMRFHSMILSISHAIPFIGLSYGKKTHSLLQEINWQYTAQNTNITPESISNMIESIEKNYDDISRKITDIYTHYKEEYIRRINTILGT